MKAKILVAAMAIGMFAAALVSTPTQQVVANSESGGSCKWSKLSCGVFSGSYEACLDNGDGNSCECGKTTRNCK